jgi:hypothetical protein
LGIGTATPLASIHNTGTSILSGAVAINSTNTATGFALFVNGVMRASSVTLSENLTMGENFAISNNGNQTIDIDANNNQTNAVFRVTNNGTTNEIFRANEAGNFMIGTTTDAGYKLDVNGTARVTGTGSTSATTSFTVRNSVGTSMLTVKDGGSDKVVTMASAVIASIDISSTIIQVGSGNSIRFNAPNGCAFNTSYLTPHASAQVDVASTTKGFLPPRMTTTQKNAIASPAAGLVVYDTTLNKLCVYTTAWETITSV